MIIHPSLGVSKILAHKGRVVGQQTVTCASVLDDECQFAPTFTCEPAPEIKADTVIVAIGQRADPGEFPGVEKMPSGSIKLILKAKNSAELMCYTMDDE